MRLEKLRKFQEALEEALLAIRKVKIKYIIFFFSENST